MKHPTYSPPWLLQNGLAMTLFVAFRGSDEAESTRREPEPPYQPQTFFGAGGVPIFGLVAIPEHPRGTIVATYGITGTLDNQWFLKILGRKAFAQGYAIVLFDWRAHGKTAELSPTLTSDGLYEGEDFVRIAAQSKALGCPAPFWFSGYSLGGQLALWAVQAAQTIEQWGSDLGLTDADLGGGAVICPSLDSIRSLQYLMQHPLGRQLEQAIARQLKLLALQLHDYHPNDISLNAVSRANSIWTFDQELVIPRLGFATVEDYYTASSALTLLPNLKKPTLILYAADDPLFDPSIVDDLQSVGAENPAIDLFLTAQGGHVGYISSKACQQELGDSDPWWAWNRILEWIQHFQIKN